MGLMIFLFVLGVYMIDLGYYDKNYTLSYSVHKSVGILALFLAFVQIVWSLSHQSPQVLSSLKPWEKAAASMMHRVLFILVLLVPLSGYGIAAAVGQGIDMFGFLTIPAVIPDGIAFKGLATEDIASGLHYYLAYGCAALVLLHLLAALKHHFIDKDRTLRRMTF